MKNALRTFHIEIMKMFDSEQDVDMSFDLLSQVLQGSSSDLKSKIASIAPLY